MWTKAGKVLAPGLQEAVGLKFQTCVAPSWLCLCHLRLGPYVHFPDPEVAMEFSEGFVGAYSLLLPLLHRLLRLGRLDSGTIEHVKAGRMTESRGKIKQHNFGHLDDMRVRLRTRH